MPKTPCHACNHLVQWTWDEAFNKFGFGDGDGTIETQTVVNVLRHAGYEVTTYHFGIHNEVIDSIKKDGVEYIPANTDMGCDEPRKYLPRKIVRLLDRKPPPEELL